MKSQRGLSTVEFALVGAVSLTVLLGCIEIGRTFYVLNTLDEITRRVARAAVVCPIGDASVAERALFGEPAGTFLPDFSTANVQVEYLDASGTASASYDEVSQGFIRVSISDYEHTLFLPFMGGAFSVPTFTTTLPAESLGYVPGADRTCAGI